MRKVSKLLVITGAIILFIFSVIFCKSVKNNAEYTGAFETGIYKNLFIELPGVSNEDVNQRIELTWGQLFYGDNDEQRIYYPVAPDMAYIFDVNNGDVRTEGMSYGMMIAVQMDKKQEFDRIWKWTKTYMQHKEGPREGYFAWHCKTNGEVIDSGSASDGEEWFVMALFLASNRWGDGEGIFNYKAEAQNILDMMIGKVESSDHHNVVTNMFNKDIKQIVFVPNGQDDYFTDPSYHTPHFYELWGLWADKENQFWLDVADTSRKFLKKAVNPATGLAPDYSTFDGVPFNLPGNLNGHEDFRYDAWRVAMNIAVDYQWFAKDEWAVTQSNRLLNFFYNQGIKTYGGLYKVDGTLIDNTHNGGLVAMNAVAALASDNENRKEFVKELWDMPVPAGKYRYYDGVLYFMATLQLSGNFKIYFPQDKKIN